MPFTSVTYNSDLKHTPARVNRLTGELQLNPATWPHLPASYRKFILLHEAGHIIHNTPDEAAVNQFAIMQYLTPFRNNPALYAAAQAEVQEITNPETTRAFSNFDVLGLGSAFQGLGNIFQSLPFLGVGSGKRQDEATNNTFLQLTKAEQDQANSTKTILVGGVLLFVLLITFVILKKK